MNNRAFYQANLPAAHFRTSSQVGGPFAAAICSVAREVYDRLGEPDEFQLVDVGAGAGELLTGMLDYKPKDHMYTYGVDIRDRPADLDSRIGWICSPAEQLPLNDITGLLICAELLDDIAIEHRASLATALCSRMRAGAILFVDYACTGSEELTAYRDGRQVRPTADGSVNVTAHVDFDELENVCRRFGSVQRWRQSDALTHYAPATEGTGIAALESAANYRLLTDPAGLGQHEWLLVQIDAGSGIDRGLAGPGETD